MSACVPEAVFIETVSLRRVSRTLGFAQIRLPQVRLSGLKVEEQPNGTLKLTPPTQRDRQGREWGVWSLQPGAKEAVEREVSILWARS